MAAGKPAVSVCMPVYEGAAFVARALRSVLAQTHAELKVRVSVDRSSDRSLEACRRFEADPRVRVFAQDERRGWVANTNELLSRVDTDYFFILPQDDVLAADYVAALLERLQREPAAVCAYGDISTFGAGKLRLSQPSIVGGLERRLVAFLLGQMPAVAFRGLVARHRLEAPVLLRHNGAGDFAADTVWMLELACAGELHRVPGMRYAKRVHESSETRRWAARPGAERLRDWLEHCVQCARIALGAVDDEAARAMVALAAAARLRQWQPKLVYHAKVSKLSGPQRVALGRAFAQRAGLPPNITSVRALAARSALAPLLPPALSDPSTPQTMRRIAAFVDLARKQAAQAARTVASGAVKATVPPLAHPRGPDLAVSVITCSIDPVKRERIRAEYERVFAGRRLELIQIPDAKSLSEAYNRGFARSRGDVIVFSHDDIEVMSEDFADRLLAHLARSDLVGVAGTTLVAGPSWVRAYSPYLHGCIVHAAPRNACSFDFFGPPRASGIQAVDGVFFAATRKLCQAVSFDEKTFDGFHHYDIDFSFRAHLAGFRVGVACDLLLLHQSRGKFEGAWYRYAERFMEKHRAQLLVESPPRRTDWPTLLFERRAAALEYHRLMQGAVAGL